MASSGKAISNKQMTATLTVRLPPPALRRLRARARALGVTPSDLARVALEREVGSLAEDASVFELTRDLIGVVSGPTAPGRDARADLEDWNPDRRG
jgi:hypothetical protein